jgi:hypothetical protein
MTPAKELSRSEATSFQYTYEDLYRVSQAYNESSDCTVIATCVVTNSAYPKVHEMFRQSGRRRRCGSFNVVMFKILADLGYKVHDVSLSYPARTVRSIVPQLPKIGRYIVQASGHVTGVVDGVAHDHAHDQGLFVEAVWQVIGLTDPIPDPVKAVESARGRWAGAVTAQAAIRALAAREYKATLQREQQPYAPFVKRWWLALRARVMAEAERQGLKRTTASIELGKWQNEIGYDMRTLR